MKKGLKIDSCTVGMGATARYRSRTLTHRRFALMDYRESLAGGGGNSDAAEGAGDGGAGDGEQDEVSLLDADTWVAADLTLKRPGGQNKGSVRSTSVFLYENGDMGTVQHLDVVKYYAKA